MTDLAKDPTVLHEQLAEALPRAMGRPLLPQTRVDLRNVTVTCERVQLGDGEASSGLPTLPNTIRSAVAGMFATRRVVKQTILHDVSVRFKPGTMTLVLGQPGSGKSTLLKLAAARFPFDDKSIDVQGEVAYNGHSVIANRELRARAPQFASYVIQQDVHFPTLSPKETFQFAHEMIGGEVFRDGDKLFNHGTPSDNQAAATMTHSLNRQYPELMLEQLGLQNCANTRIGDAMMRGVSGGQRKRVTMGEMEFGLKCVSLLDEISTGLDSAATFDIVYAQREKARKLGTAIVISLLQPTPEVFELFDDVIVLNAGHVLYYGPTSTADAYFADLGFRRPAGRDVADFLLDLGTNEQLKYEVRSAHPSSDALKVETVAFSPRTPQEFADKFRQSHICGTIVDEMMIAASEPSPLSWQNTPIFHQSLWANISTLIRREMILLSRDNDFIRGRVVMLVLMGLIYGSVYYQADMTDVQVVIGVLFSSALFLMLGQTAQIASFLSARAVFYKHRSANMARSPAYVIASCVRQLPLAATEAVVFGSLVYWLVGLQASVERFLVFEAVMALTVLVYVSWFFLLSTLAPNQNILFPIAMIAIVFFIVFAGFVMPRGEMPDYLVWIYWIDPLAWVIRALAVNEYRYGKFAECVYEGVDYCTNFGMTSGEYYLSLFDIPSSKTWIAFVFVYLAAVYVICMMLSSFVLEHVRYEALAPAGSSVDSDSGKQGGEDGAYALATTPRDMVLTMGTDEGARRKVSPVTLAFEDLHYSVPVPTQKGSDNEGGMLKLLNGISGYALPGTITALMGSTGAGKTTLMDVIAGRKQTGNSVSGVIEGRILLNGYEATPLAIQRSTGYCEQMDVHSEASTFREALTFSAFLRQDSSVSTEEKLDAVTECLDLLGLTPIADQIIRGSSMEQLKRLTIGVELAAHPSVLFLDEPTSGLDARSAKLIMDGVRKVADSGRTVVCTIHQPSAEVFSVFDNLLLLKLGGETVYFGNLGRDNHTLVNYFEALPGVRHLPEAYNPATWMLECIGAGVAKSDNRDSSEIDFVDTFKSSRLHSEMVDTLNKEGIGHPSPDSSELQFGRKRAASSATQMRLLISRFLRLYWRTPSYNLTRFGVYTVLAIIFGVLFVGISYETYQGINAGLGVINMTVVFAGFMSFNSVLPMTMEDRAAFYRERAAQTYSALWYFAGSTVAEVPYVFFAGLLFSAITFPLLGFSGVSTFALYWLIVSTHMLQQTYLGQLLVYALPSLEVAALLGAAVNSILMMFVGFNPPAASIPQGYRWLYDITPQRYTMSMLSTIVFGECDYSPVYNETLGEYVGVSDSDSLGCQPLTGVPLSISHTTVKEYLDDTFSMRRDDLWTYYGITIAFIVVFRFLALVTLRFVNHQKK